MKKRIVCALLALIMLVGLVPAAALTTSAASMSTSEAAITVLKQLEGYSTKCDTNGYTGYGTKCTEKGTHGSHTTTEKKADVALREALADLDTAINNFASKNGLSLTQSKHDALVLFSFENGTAWTTGTGDFKAAVTSRLSGSAFLNAICRWDASTADDNRRMVEANMYLNGVYSATKPSQFIRVNFNLNPGYDTMAEFDENGDPVFEDVVVFVTDDEGNIVYDDDGEPQTKVIGEELKMVDVYDDASMAQTATQYFDVSLSKAITLTPTNSYHYFLGWYTEKEEGVQVTSLNANYHNATLYAHWQGIGDDYGVINTCYEIATKNLASDSVYSAPNGKELKMALDDYVWVGSEYIDYNGQRWGGLVQMVGDGDGNSIMDPSGYIYGWVKLKEKTTSSTSSSDNSIGIDVTVTVTNSYVNRRAEASIYSNKTGSYTMGTQLRIINTASKDGFLWGQVAESATSNASAGWIALMYTNFESVKSQSTVSTNNSTVVATAVIDKNGNFNYVNVRSDAGTSNQIVGALPKGTEVDLYETKYVNGIQWGRCASGWFCLSYATVTRLVADTSYTSDTGYLSYVFSGTITAPLSVKIYDAPGETSNLISDYKALKGDVTVTNLTNVNGITWGKISEGWVKVSDASGNALDVTLDITKYTVTADTLTVRNGASTGSTRVDTLSKGVEFNVNQSKQVIVSGDSVWGWADKVGEENKTYGGWVNLATKYVSRSNVPTVSNTNAYSGMVATIVGADSVRVRGDSTLSGKVLGSIARGTVVNILGEDNGWYKIDYEVDDDASTDSWVYGQYVEISEGSATATATGETGIGIVSNTYGGVNVRVNPGTGSAQVTKLPAGTQVNILEVVTYGTSKWGRISQGWVCMDYITIISDLPDEVLAALGTTNNGSASGSTSNVSSTEVAIYTGTTKQKVNVRKEPSLNAEIVRELEGGANITLHEIVTVVDKVTTKTDDSSTGATITTKETTSYWARVNDGYIYNPADHLNLDTLDEATYTLTESDTLNVRKTPGSENKSSDDKLFKLAKYDQVAVTKLQIVNGKVWGYVECDAGEGWASLAYMTKGTVYEETVTETTPSVDTTTPTTETTAPVMSSTGNIGSGTTYTGKIINNDTVNVRKTASLNADVATTLKRGSSVTIYETVISEYMAWGRCDSGWIYLYYVDLTPVSGGVDARVVYNDGTLAYSDTTCSEVTGSYVKMAVVNIYEVVGKMARTDLGWVNTDNLL